MRKINTALLSALLLAWLFGGSWWYANKYRSAEPTATNHAFSLSVDSLQFTAAANFFFSKSSSRISVPQSTNAALQAIVTYLLERPQQNLQLTGIFNSQEVNDSASKSLGLARAQALKEVLTDFGANPEQITTSDLKVNQDLFHNNYLQGGVYFSFLNVPTKRPLAHTDTAPTEPADEANTITIEKLNLYFPKNKYKLKMTPELEAYFNKLKQYLTYHSEAKILITGFTDNQGKPANNLRLSKYRARKVKAFMMKYGFSKKQLSIDYQGAANPIASNDTEEGREKNRRVEIRIKV